MSEDNLDDLPEELSSIYRHLRYNIGQKQAYFEMFCNFLCDTHHKVDNLDSIEDTFRDAFVLVLGRLDYLRSIFKAAEAEFNEHLYQSKKDPELGKKQLQILQNKLLNLWANPAYQVISSSTSSDE